MVGISSSAALSESRFSESRYSTFSTFFTLNLLYLCGVNAEAKGFSCVLLVDDTSLGGLE